MIIKGSKQQRNVAKRTKQLQNDIKKLVLDYEQEVEFGSDKGCLLQGQFL